MKILHVASGLQKASGVTTFVENVVREARASGHLVDVCTNAQPAALRHVPDYDLVHIHGLWNPLLHRAGALARKAGIPVVWSTHGMTAPWSMKHKWWKKLPAWWFFQCRDLQAADLVHCTTDLEIGWNHALGLKRTCLVSLGTSLPKEEGLGPGTRSTVNGKILLFVGRIYPVKALDRLIEAFQMMSHEGWRLRIVGPDQAGHLAELKKIAGPEVDFPGPKFGEELDAEYANCEALALVSHTENFGATVIDAMAHGKPVIASTKTPWRIVSERGCGWWVDNDSVTLAKAIGEMMALSGEERTEMGRRGRNLVKEKFSWSAVAKRIISEYEKVVCL